MANPEEIDVAPKGMMRQVQAERFLKDQALAEVERLRGLLEMTFHRVGSVGTEALKNKKGVQEVRDAIDWAFVISCERFTGGRTAERLAAFKTPGDVTLYDLAPIDLRTGPGLAEQ